jgi:hypothetical protein
MTAAEEKAEDDQPTVSLLIENCINSYVKSTLIILTWFSLEAE